MCVLDVEEWPSGAESEGSGIAGFNSCTEYNAIEKASS